MEPKPSYVKAEYFAQPKLIVHSALKREKAEVLGISFADKGGFANREIFIEKETGEEKHIDNTNWGMFKAFKEAELHPGDEAVVVSILIQDPYDTTKTYRHWFVQKVKTNNEATVQVEEKPKEDNWE